jgi:hypothetical protein
MTSLRSGVESPRWPWTFSWKTLFACIAGALLASTVAHAEGEVRSKRCLTLPTLLEMSGKATYQELARRCKGRLPCAVISLGPALVANRLCPGHGKRTMREPEVQIGNSGQEISESARGKGHEVLKIANNEFSPPSRSASFGDALLRSECARVRGGIQASQRQRSRPGRRPNTRRT